MDEKRHRKQSEGISIKNNFGVEGDARTLPGGGEAVEVEEDREKGFVWGSEHGVF